MALTQVLTTVALNSLTTAQMQLTIAIEQQLTMVAFVLGIVIAMRENLDATFVSLLVKHFSEFPSATLPFIRALQDYL